MEKLFFESYKLIPFKYGSCKDIPRLLRHIADDDVLALGEVNLFYPLSDIDRKPYFFCFTFKATPNTELKAEKSELQKKIKELIKEIGDNNHDYTLEIIFKKNGLYDEWNDFELSRKAPSNEYEMKDKAEKQLELFRKLLYVFSNQSHYYKWKKFELEDLLKQV